MSDDRDKMSVVIFIFIPLVLLLALIVSCFRKEPPKPPIEQIRNERNERFNEAGKSVNNFVRGALGMDKTKPVEVPQQQPAPEKK